MFVYFIYPPFMIECHNILKIIYVHLCVKKVENDDRKQ